MTRERPSLVINDLDSTVGDSVFDCHMVSRYGNYDNKERPKFPYLHADVTDVHGFCTITVTIQGPLVYTYSDKFVVGRNVRLENSSVKEKHKDFEEGDSDFVVKVSSSTVITNIPEFPPPFALYFLATDTIKSFSIRMHEKYSKATIAVAVISLRGEIEGRYELSVADGINPKDIQIVQFNYVHNRVYEELASKFRSGAPTFITMKNISGSTIGDVRLIALSFTCFAPITDSDTIYALNRVFEALVRSDGPMVTREVTGILRITNPTTSPFIRVCSRCNLNDMQRQGSSSSFYYNRCQAANIPSLAVRINIIVTQENGSLESMHIKSGWLGAVIGQEKPEFLATHTANRRGTVKLLSQIRVTGRFSLSPIGEFVGFAEVDWNVENK